MGDNLRFREELTALAASVLACVNEQWSDQPREYEHASWYDTAYPQRLPKTSAPGGILPSRLEWLCQPEHIEHTLHLLFHLNHWAQAHEHFLYLDRQGLYQIKAAIMRQAHTVGAIHCVVYIDASQTFAHNFSIELAVDTATETFMEALSDLFVPERLVTHDNEMDRKARLLFQRITGHAATGRETIDQLDEKQVAAYIKEQILQLIEQARTTRQPIAGREFAALFIEPMDLLDIHNGRNYFWPRWEEMDESDTRKLDPEGLSLIAFLYTSPVAHYVFHLPFRVAEAFLSPQLLLELKSCPGHSREFGVYYGQAITEAESQSFSIDYILRELLVDITSICPHRLLRKNI